MAKVLEPPANLYDQDFVAWLEQQVAHLHAGRLDALDVGHLIEELEATAGRDRRELRSRLEVLILHLLKRDRSAKTVRSWESTIVEQRAQIVALLEESPSLRRSLDELVQKAYPTAAQRASIETGAKRNAFPESSPYRHEQILEDETDG